MSGAATPYDAGNIQPPRTRVRTPRTRIMSRAAVWQPAPLSAGELPASRTDHGPFLDARGKPLRLAADPQGLSTVGGGADIQWGDVTRFVCRAYDSRRTGPGMRYSVLTQRDAIGWDVPSDADPAMRQEHEGLCRLIASRTGLLLIEEGVVAPAWPVEMREGRMVALAPVADDAHPRTGPSRTRRRGRRGIWRMLGMLVVLVALVVGTAYATATFLAHVGAFSAPPNTLASTVHGSTTTYYDALTLSDGDWPVGVLPESGATTAFVSNAYVQTAKTQPATALAPGAYGGSALEVTVGGPQGSGAAGLAMRASADGGPLLVFAVSSTGRWMLGRGTAGGTAASSMRTLGGGATGVIRRGATASNSLLVIPHGARLLCFVNDHYVGSVDLKAADTAGLPKTGGAGLWVAAGTTATFTAFAVYPAP